MPTPRTPYEILGVDPSASTDPNTTEPERTRAALAAEEQRNR